MIKAISVIVVMVLINAFMVFAVFKVAARLDDSLRRYFVVKIGNSEYSKIRINRNFGTIVGEESDSAKNEADLDITGNPVDGGEGDGEGEGGEGNGGIPMGDVEQNIIQSSFAADLLNGKPEIQKEMVPGGPGTGYQQALKNNYGEPEVKKEFVSTEESQTNITTIPSAEEVTVARYKNSNYKDEYKSIRKLSVLDKPAALSVVRDVQIKTSDDPSSDAFSIMKMMDYETAFSLASFDNERQEAILRDIFTPGQTRILDAYIAQYPVPFSAVDFYGYIRNLCEISDDNYYVYTSREHENLSVYGADVQHVYDDEIAEGIKVVYKNKLYDYSV